MISKENLNRQLKKDAEQHLGNNPDYEKASVSEDFKRIQVLFGKFCSSSTIHGTYFWSESQNPLSKLIWAGVVLVGIALATFTIKRSFQSWAENPVVTSVLQIPIEKIAFPAITICPVDDNR